MKRSFFAVLLISMLAAQPVHAWSLGGHFKAFFEPAVAGWIHWFKGGESGTGGTGGESGTGDKGGESGTGGN